MIRGKRKRSWVGDESAMWSRRVDDYDQLCSHEDERIRRVGEIGKAEMENLRPATDRNHQGFVPTTQWNGCAIMRVPSASAWCIAVRQSVASSEPSAGIICLSESLRACNGSS